MAKVKAKLRDLSLRGETTHTRWGHVTFNRDGLAELEVEESDLPMLRDMGWLAKDPIPPQPTPPTHPEAESTFHATHRKEKDDEGKEHVVTRDVSPQRVAPPVASGTPGFDVTDTPPDSPAALKQRGGAKKKGA